jgi:iron complex transport system substrate-binding protein
MKQSACLSRRKFLALSLASAGAVGANTLIQPQQALAVENTRATSVFIDDLGRRIRVPDVINGVTPTGVNAQTMLFELCPDKIASLAMEISTPDAADYQDADMGELAELPKTGALLSTGGADIDSEEVVDISPVVMIDVGLPKEGLADKLNALQLETNIPYIFIDISFGKLPQAYRTLGSLLGCEQRAEALASYVEAAMSEVKEIASNLKTPCKVFYAHREQGLAVTGGIPLQLDAIAYTGAIAVIEPYDYTARQINFDALVGADIDWVLFDDTSVLQSLQLGEGEAWDIWSETILSCRAGFAVSPALYHSWLGSMVFVQSIGLLWLTSVMWPASRGYDMEQRAREFYALFYGLGLVDEKAQELIGSIPPEDVLSYASDPEFVSNHAEEVISDDN